MGNVPLASIPVDRLPIARPSAADGLAKALLMAQAAPSTGGDPYTISSGPEYDRWNEALAAHGAIRIPRELDDPQKWLEQNHIKRFLEHNGVNREDRPDGSVILRMITPTS